MSGKGIFPMASKRKFPRGPQRRWNNKNAKWFIKRKSRIIGAVYALSNGELAYLARRWRGEIFCGGEASISAAIAAGKESWAFDHDHLLELRMKGVKYVGVIERERDGYIYLTTMDVCWDPARFAYKNFQSRGGALQHYISHKHFIKKAGSTKF